MNYEKHLQLTNERLEECTLKYIDNSLNGESEMMLLSLTEFSSVLFQKL